MAIAIMHLPLNTGDFMRLHAFNMVNIKQNSKLAKKQQCLNKLTARKFSLSTSKRPV